MERKGEFHAIGKKVQLSGKPKLPKIKRKGVFSSA